MTSPTTLTSAHDPMIAPDRETAVSRIAQSGMNRRTALLALLCAPLAACGRERPEPIRGKMHRAQWVKSDEHNWVWVQVEPQRCYFVNGADVMWAECQSATLPQSNPGAV